MQKHRFASSASPPDIGCINTLFIIRVYANLITKDTAILGTVTNETSVRLGKRIKELRKKRGWRQIDLAVHAEVNKTHISDLERGKREFCLNTLEAIAGALEEKSSALLRSIGR